eukprot:202026-Hanusia_phi.AAC.4
MAWMSCAADSLRRDADISVGKFNSDEDRIAMFCAIDDGSLQGGFLNTLKGSKYKLHPDVAKGAKASKDLIALLNKVRKPRLRCTRLDNLQFQATVNKYTDRKTFLQELVCCLRWRMQG